MFEFWFLNNSSHYNKFFKFYPYRPLLALRTSFIRYLYSCAQVEKIMEKFEKQFENLDVHTAVRTTYVLIMRTVHSSRTQLSAIAPVHLSCLPLADNGGRHVLGDGHVDARERRALAHAAGGRGERCVL